MPIQVACKSCAGKFRVPDNVAGKKIRCPKCKEVIEVPAAEDAGAAQSTPTAPAKAAPKPTSSASASPSKAAAPKPSAPAAAKTTKPATENWFLKTEDGESYGPVPRAELDAWHAEGRVTVDCQVLREGSDQWQWASELYPELDPASAEQPVARAPDAADSPGVQVTPQPAAEPTPKQAPAAPTPAKKTTAAPTPKKVELPAEAFAGAPEPSTPADNDDNPFAFLGGGGGSGGEAFNFSTSPSASTSAKVSTKAAKKPTTPAAAADDSPTDGGEVSSKSKLTAGLLAIFLGSLGVHRFYLGYTLIGVLQLLLCGGCGIWQLIDVIMIFTGKLPDAQGRPLKG